MNNPQPLTPQQRDELTKDRDDLLKHAADIKARLADDDVLRDGATALYELIAQGDAAARTGPFQRGVPHVFIHVVRRCLATYTGTGVMLHEYAKHPTLSYPEMVDAANLLYREFKSSGK